MRLPDWLFYPLAMLVAIALVGAALRYGPGATRPPGPFAGAPKDGFELTGHDLGLMQAGPGLSADLADADGSDILRAAAGHGPDEGGRSAGVFVALPRRFGAFYAGKKIVASMELRSTENPPPQAFIAYYSIWRHNGPHVSCPLSARWHICTMRYRPPPLGNGKAIDYFGLWPDVQGLSRTVDIKSVRVRLDDGSEQPSPPAPDLRQ